MTYEHNTTVLGGLPVTIEYEIESADYDVGIMSDGVGDWWITHVNDRSVKNADWIINKMSAKDIEKLIDELNVAAAETAYYEYGGNYEDDY